MKKTNTSRDRWTRFLSALLCFVMILGVTVTPKASAATTTLQLGEAYYIKETTTGRYLTVNGGKDYNFNPVGVNALVSAPSQRWVVRASSYGGYQLFPECSTTRILDVSSGQTDIYLNKGCKNYNSFFITGNPFTGCQISNQGKYLYAESGKANKWSYVKVSSTTSSTWIFEPVNPVAAAPNEYTVTFYVDGEAYDTQTVEENCTADMVEEPYLNGCYFEGWFEEGAEDPYDFSPVTESIDLYAKFTVPVKLFYSIDGIYVINELDVPYEERLNESDLPIELDTGYEAAGWYLDESYENMFDFSESLTEPASLYLKSVRKQNSPEPVVNEYTVQVKLFYSIDGIYVINELDVPYGERLNESDLPIELDTGYEAAGWYIDDACHYAFDFTEPLTAPTNLFLKSIRKRIVGNTVTAQNAFFSAYISGYDDLMEIWYNSTVRECEYMTNQDSFLYWGLWATGGNAMPLAQMQVKLFGVMSDYATEANYHDTIINFNGRHDQVVAEVGQCLLDNGFELYEFPLDIVLREIYYYNCYGKLLPTIGGTKPEEMNDIRISVVSGGYAAKYFELYELYAGFTARMYYGGMNSAQKKVLDYAFSGLNRDQFAYFFREDDVLGSVIKKYFDFTPTRGNHTSSRTELDIKGMFYLTKAYIINQLKSQYFKDNFFDNYTDDDAWDIYRDCIYKCTSRSAVASDEDMIRAICSQLHLETRDLPFITHTAMDLSTANDMIRTVLTMATNQALALNPEMCNVKVIRTNVNYQVNAIRAMLDETDSTTDFKTVFYYVGQLTDYINQW